MTARLGYKPLSAMTEKVWQSQVVAAAKLMGWKVYHPWLSIKSTAGWPDLALCKGRVLVIAELKREGRQPSPRQQEWLDALDQVPGVLTYCWMPSQWDDVIKVLKGDGHDKTAG